MTDEFDLIRFVEAQAGVYESALTELRQGRKTSHWMWFVFPQYLGLGQSSISKHFAIRSLAEARAYLAHPLLGPRLRECAAALLPADPSGAGTRSDATADAEEVFGAIDAVKLRSSMTLFLRANPGEDVFERVLEHFFQGHADPLTDQALGDERPPG